jgi:hypothetical protein
MASTSGFQVSPSALLIASTENPVTTRIGFPGMKTVFGFRFSKFSTASFTIAFAVSMAVSG